MFRYVALMWNADNDRQAQAAALVTERVRSVRGSWQIVLDRDGLRVFCADMDRGSLRATLLTHNAGVVLGQLFARHDDVGSDDPCEPIALDSRCSAAVVESRGRWLIERCWGNYVAFVTGGADAACYVLKDPCGTLPCFSTSFQGIAVVFSAISDCVRLHLLRFSINWRHVEARLVTGDLAQVHAALNEVTQIGRGECAEFDPRREPLLVRKHVYWDPVVFANDSEVIDAPDRGTRMLRNTLRACTRTLAGGHATLMVRLSGGLDSSIVLGCLKNLPGAPHLLAYTQYATDAATDLRPWARMVTHGASCEHIEQQLSPGNIRLEKLLEIAPSVEPVAASMLIAIGSQEQMLMHQRGVTAVFTGDGGDCAFGSLCVGEVLTAYLRRRGLRPFAFRLASQSALVLQQTAWAILARSMRSWITGRGERTVTEANSEARKLVSRELGARCSRQADPHPWLAAADRVPWEVVSKLGALLGTPDFYAGVARPEERAPQIIAPIYAQPVVELCLRIPADVLFTGGCDRGLARRAFIGDVPEPILRRVWKDRAGTFHDQVVQLNLRWLREMLLDGVLMGAGLLDRAAVERALTHGPSANQVHAAEIMRHVETEAWARQWLASTAQDSHGDVKTQQSVL